MVQQGQEQGQEHKEELGNGQGTQLERKLEKERVVEEICEEILPDGTQQFTDPVSGAKRELEDVQLPPGWTWRSNWKCDAQTDSHGVRRWRRIREAPAKARISAGKDPSAVQSQLLSLQQLLCSDTEHLEALTARIGGNLDSEDLRSRIRLHCALADVHLSAGPALQHALAVFEHDVKDPTRRAALAQTRAMLEKDLARQRAKLETALWSVRDRIRVIPSPRPINVKSVQQIHENVHLPSTASDRATRDQELASEMLLQSTMDVNAEFYRERETDIRDIAHDVALTSEIMSTAAEGIFQQGEMVDRVDENLSPAQDDADASCVCS
ncbi:Hypothetical Protein FCC1311_070882 [Hondaea fermentalgiana]|uniref:t-SNARE coiled-coil homology domain-containing protein n=1 Tax=Hondaea fermentalgiana TaxID=2315210 RepID=A0A2R5GMA4_9STRA|nr:Hypothetical Protein FCC1311_070882 [Hondaea fermentalgiana]|eukprot:GBG30868.1 Hypothetical Protein FCC1311_070882 [Hondaea fermentalgiana]